jgi:adenylate cyclase
VAGYVVKMDKHFIVVNYNRSVNFAGDLDPPIRIPVDEEGRMMVNYVGPVGTFPYVQAADVLSGKVSQKRFDGKVVFIGLTEGDKAGFHATPYSPKSPRVDITANAVATVLDRQYVTQAAAGSWVALGFLALFLALTFPFFTALGATAWGVACLLGYTVLAWVVFRSGHYGLLPILPAYLLIVLMWLGSLVSRPFTLARRIVYA